MKSFSLSQKGLNFTIAIVIVVSVASIHIYSELQFRKCVESYTEPTLSLLERYFVTPEGMCKRGYDIERLYDEAVNEYTTAEGFGEPFEEKMEDISLILEWKIIQMGN